MTPTLLVLLALTAAAQEPAPAPVPVPAPEAEPPAAPEAEAPAPEQGGELPIVAMPSIVTYVEAPYPEEAKAQGLSAVVKLRITLTAEGEVENVAVLEPQGHGFDEAAVDAVLAMTWAPARTEAGPVGVVFDFDYGFVLEEEPAPPPEVVEQPVNVEGVVLEMATREPLPDVQVGVLGTDLATVTDAEGRFQLRGVPEGGNTLHLVHLGHVTEDKPLEVVPGEVTSLKLWMRAEAYRENESVAVYDRPKDEVTRRTISIQEIKRVPGTFGDPVRVVQTLPGAARTPFGTGLLVIRGADPEDSGVYIDGVRVPIIYHLTGTTSVLSPELIAGVDYLPGGYGVQYGRTMGGTVDVKTKDEFDEHGRLVWGTDILDSQVYFEGQLGKNDGHGLALGVRRSYIDLFIPIFTGDTGFVLKPRYVDYQAKWIPRVGEDDKVSLFFYGFDDLLEVATPDDVAQGADQDTQGDLGVRYNSHRIVGKWTHDFSETARFELTPSFGLDATDSFLGDEFGIGGDNWVGQVRTQLAWKPFPELELVPGADLLGIYWTFQFQSAINIEAFDDPLAEREPVGFDGYGTVWAPDVFLKANLRPLKHGSDRWLVTPGLRGNIVAIDSNGGLTGDQELPTSVITSVDPRILTRYAFDDDGRFAIKGATGLYHQPPQPQEALGVGTQASVGYERSFASSVGWEQRLTKAVVYDVDLFYREMKDLVVYDENWTGFGSNPFFNGGEGRAYGMELMARHDPIGPFFGWVSYTLSKASRKDPFACEDNVGEGSDLWGTGPCWYPFDFDQTHIFSAQAGYDLPFDFGVSAQVQLVSGNPSDEYDTGIYDADSDYYVGFRAGGWNQERMPPYFQTSLRFDKLFTFRQWQLETYVDLLNAVRGVNPEFTVYNYDYTEFAYVRGLPFIPNIGLEARFYP